MNVMSLGIWEERRAFIRVVTTLPATVVSLDAAGNWRRVGAVVLDIGVGGLRLRADESFGYGERVQVSIELPDGQGRLDASANIEECEPDLDAFNIRTKFVGLSGDSIIRVARWTLAMSTAERARVT